MAIAQTQTEQTISPIITVLTSQWACQNRWNSDRSEDVNGKADGTMSAGFMGASFPRSGLAQSRDLGHVRDHAGAWTNGSLSRPPNLRADQTRKFHEDPSRTRHRQDRESSPNLSKLGRNTRSFAPNEARLSLMRR